jgi:hypothetical protein
MGWFGPYVYKDKNKQKWWLHSKEKGKTKVYYFSKDSEGAVYDIPSNYQITVNKITGLPMLKKIFKAPRRRPNEGEQK